MTRLGIEQLLEKARAELSRLEPEDAWRQMAAGATVIDVRTSEQIARDGMVPDAVQISLNVLEWRLDPDSPTRDAAAPGLDDLVIIMCDEGFSSSLAAWRLHALGFHRATDVIGGFQAWRQHALPVDSSRV